MHEKDINNMLHLSKKVELFYAQNFSSKLD